jgi:lincosamide nucleotidyltransferase A/C/D/E
MFAGWTQDPAVTRYLTWSPHRAVDQTRRFIQGCLEAWRGDARKVWVITRFGAEDEPIGLIELRTEAHRAELGYVLARAAWGQGVMTEVAQTLAQLALHELPIARVAAWCDVDNRASARVLEKAGLLREGRLRRYVLHPNVSDEPRDVNVYARTRPLHASVHAEDVLAVLELLAQRGLRVWVAGGWGVDALLGRQTREHADVDLACRAEDEAPILAALQQRGYRVVLDYRPARVALADDDGREVDLHPVRFDADGRGIQAGLHGQQFAYPPDAFGAGTIGGQAVACLSVAQQLRFHTGYALREHDRQDLAALRAAASRRPSRRLAQRAR